MPVSRGRKKKSKSKKANGPTRTFEQNGIKISQKGDMTYIHNKRTEQEHLEYIEHIKHNRPAFFHNLKEQIQDVILDIEKYDKLTLLGIISAYAIDKQFEDDGKGEVTLEYAQSICLASPNDNKNNLPTFEDGNRIIQKLIEIRTGFSLYYGSEQIVGKNSELENNIRYPMILESLFVRGDGYVTHLYEVFRELFAPHDDFLKEKYGFKANDILDTFLQLEDSFCIRIIYRDKTLHPAHYMRWERWKRSNSPTDLKVRNLSPMEAFEEDNPDLPFENGKPKLFWIHDRTTYKALYEIRLRYPEHINVVKALSIQFGGNSEFLNPLFTAEPLNDSKIFKCPIIQEDGKYYLFAFNIAARNLLKIGENLIESVDSEYYNSHYLGNKYTHTRDVYLENKVAELFKRFLPNVQFFGGVKYVFNNDGSTTNCNNKNEKKGLIETELDLLGIGKTAIYLIEIKAGALNDSAKRGAIKSLKTNLKETVGYASCQSFRAKKFIEESDKPIFYDKGKKEIIADKSKRIYRISISLDHLGGLVTNLFDLKELNIIDKNTEFAWTVSLYDLMIFSEIIENENDFMEYLDQRLTLYLRENIEIPDEISLLGYFLNKGNIKFDQTKIKKFDKFRIEKNFSSDIDKYYHNKLVGIPSPRPTKRK
ncbi:hypothetical protein [Pedobacter rhodius]|uniref:Uncharacterized protein n=1 Tax=Pedobacter rhodius TaxID=3004098 RepID=A0ABT4KX99_9SPHI|nr:hypothetical protein [Pedobacter sp. SJ11]MCZ4223534.1 hypothetical protein [Pedobacter sp. SJ11]